MLIVLGWMMSAFGSPCLEEGGKKQILAEMSPVLGYVGRVPVHGRIVVVGVRLPIRQQVLRRGHEPDVDVVHRVVLEHRRLRCLPLSEASGSLDGSVTADNLVRLPREVGASSHRYLRRRLEDSDRLTEAGDIKLRPHSCMGLGPGPAKIPTDDCCGREGP